MARKFGMVGRGDCWSLRGVAPRKAGCRAGEGARCPWHTACVFEPGPYLAAGQNFKRKSPLALRERKRSDDSYCCTLGQEIKSLFIVGLPEGPGSNFPFPSFTIADSHSGRIHFCCRCFLSPSGQCEEIIKVWWYP